MKSVRDIFLAVLVMKRESVPFHEIGSRIIALGHDNGFDEIRERGDIDHMEFTFQTGDVILFDGSDWHHRRPTRKGD